MGREREEMCFLPVEADSFPESPWAGGIKCLFLLMVGPLSVRTEVALHHAGAAGDGNMEKQHRAHLLPVLRPPPRPSYHNVVTWGTMVTGDGFSSPLFPPGHSMRQGQDYGGQLGEGRHTDSSVS